MTLALVTAGSFIAVAHVMDDFSPPPDGDPSEHTGPSIGEEEAIDDLEDAEPANIGAVEPEAELHDTFENNSLSEEETDDGGSFNIPTGGPPSPLFGAGEFEQQMLRFEEFGTERLDTAPALSESFPSPTLGPEPTQDPHEVAASSPDPSLLESFIDQDGISPFPTEFANDVDENPWRGEIQDFLDRALDSPPAEGRPPGKGWAHQRWNEFFPQVYYNTVQAGARTNGGARDDRQLHTYSTGEFAPGGLYHTVYDPDGLVNGNEIEGTTAGIGVRFHPDLPIQDHKALWTFDGTFPPKLLNGRYGEGILMRHYNALPIDPAANRGFGLHTITTHEHNGHNPAESDGYTNSYFFPGQFYDYRWPMQLAGYDTINTLAEDPRAAFPCAEGEELFVHDDEGDPVKTCDADGRIQLRGDWRETMSTHWFHDHMLDFTATNVYKGNAVMFNYYSALDRGNEAHDDGVNLRLPSGTALPWGNRDYDVNLMIADKAWDTEGQLWFNVFNLDGFMGDRILTNWLYKPYFDVRARRYRFRILNGSVSRYFAVGLVKLRNDTSGELPGPPGSGTSYDYVDFHMIANDGNIMEHAVPFDGSMDLNDDGEIDELDRIMPTHAIAERYDIVVDFASQGIQPGDKLYFVNVLEHKTGKRPEEKIPLADVLSEEYKPVIDDDRWEDGDPGVGKFLEFRVVSYDGTDLSMDPSNFEPGGQKMIPLPIDRNDPQLADATRREFIFGRSSGTDEQPWTIKTDGGQGVGMDPRRLSAAPQLATGPTDGGFDGTNSAGDDGLGTMEIWQIVNGGGGWSHPVHVHFEEGVILSRGGNPPPEWEKWARKDVYRIGRMDDSTDSVEIAIRFREFAGTYMEHCHNTQHEDHAMLLRWDIEHPGQLKLMPAPIPTWDGVEYVDSHALPTFRDGEGTGPTGEEGGDFLTITKAEGKPSKGELRVEGTSSTASSVTIYEGDSDSSGGACPGATIGSAAVDDEEWEFRDKNLSSVPSMVCVRSDDGQIATSPVENKD
ncbi:MAG: multicopper oxidase domain-containing protein [Thermoanaerobaculia bacterium]